MRNRHHRQLVEGWEFVGGHTGTIIQVFILITWWRHQMQTFSALLALCEGNPTVIVGFPRKWQWLRYLLFSLICAWTNSWANNLDAGDLRRHRVHYDVTVMKATFNLIESIPKHHQPVKAIGSENIIDAIWRLGITKSSSTFSATNISSNIVWLIQLHDTIQMKSNLI